MRSDAAGEKKKVVLGKHNMTLQPSHVICRFKKKRARAVGFRTRVGLQLARDDKVRGVSELEF